MRTTPADRLRKARIDAGFRFASDAARAMGINRDTYLQHENGNRAFDDDAAVLYARKFKVTPEFLRFGAGKRDDGDMVPVIGYVAANADGAILFSTGDNPNAFAPAPPGGTPDSVALEVNGHSMRGIADDGALIYFEDQRTPPSPDMLGHVVILETEDGRVLVKRLLRGSSPGLYDLESIAGPTLDDVRIRWAAHITAIVPPHQARRVIRRTGEAA